MGGAFDDRLVNLLVQLVDQNGKPTGDVFQFDQNFYILATGTKFTDGNLGECAIRIDNISKRTRDFLVSKTSPWILPRLYANITLSVGRKSIGAFVLFTGQATASNPSQPPDISLTFSSITGSALLGNIGTLNGGPLTTIKSVAQQIAAQLINPVTGGLGIPLNYEATYNANISNYSFNGALIRQLQELAEIAPLDISFDNNTITITDHTQPRTGGPIIINKDNGLIGVPEVNQNGVTAKVLITSEIRPMDAITIQSQLNPAANGTFQAFQVGFEIASRAPPFYWNLDTRFYALGGGRQ